jgi:indole-3-glycerol phosphate synthase
MMDDLQKILSVKQVLLEKRQHRTPQLAVIALSDMRERPLPSLNIVHDNMPIFVIGYIPLAQTYDPVLHALRMVRAGADAVALFTDSRVYSKGQADLLLVSLGAKKTPVISFDYPLNEYHVLEMRTAGASAVMLYASLVTDTMLKRMVSIALRVRMTVIIHAETPAEFDMAVAMGPHAVSVGVGDYFNHEDENIALLAYARAHKPYNMRLMFRPCIRSVAQLAIPVGYEVDAVVLDEPLLKDNSREKLYKLLRGD